MALAERELQLKLLRRGWSEAAAGGGSLVLVSGEAGAGKSALVSAFLRDTSARVVVGACEGASAPRPLGPVIEIAAQLEVDVKLPRAELFAEVLTALPAVPTVVLIEDVHWLDGASADFLLYAGRRLAGLAAMLVLTFRDDDIAANEVLLRLVSELGRLDTSARIEVPPLTRSAVATLLSDSALNAEEVFRQTSGNAFFVTEMIAAGSSSAVTIRDVVLARTARMSIAGRTVVDVASQLGGRFGISVLVDASGDAVDGIDECVRHGLFIAAGDELSFRHELARATIADQIPPIRRAAINRTILRVLIGRSGVDVARLATHAAAANDAEAAYRYGMAAGCRAAQLSSHREAAHHYRVVARFMSQHPPAERAAVLDALVAECMVIDELGEACAAGEEAIRLWSEVGDPIRLGAAHHDQSQVLWYLGQGTAARSHAARAVAVLEPLGPSPEFAGALAQSATFTLFVGQHSRAAAQARAAIETAQQVGDASAQSNALNTLGCAVAHQNDFEDGVAYLEQALEVAIDNDLGHLAGRAYANLASWLLELHDFARCDEVISTGLRYTEDRDLTLRVICLTGYLAESELRRGRWDDALADAAGMLERAGAVSIGRLPALTIVGTIKMRRGSETARTYLNDALDAARQTGEIQHIAPIALALAEQAWLHDDLDSARAWLQTAVEVPDGAPDAAVVGQLHSWRTRLGDQMDTVENLPREYALQIAQHWAEAAELWFTLQRPYEAALALFNVDTVEALTRAFDVVDRLGARPAALKVSRRLRALGQRVPRGMRSTTRTNSAGLTAREIEVLKVVAHGQTNAEIAAQLFVSQKTVEHHVAHILTKLEAPSRREATRIARDLALIAE